LDLVPLTDPGPPQVDDPQLGTHFLDAIQNAVMPTLGNASVVCAAQATPVATQAPTAVAPTSLPGTGIVSDEADPSSGTGIWLITGLLIIAGMVGLAVYGWRHARAGHRG
jgi:hypothetical protein